MLLHLTHRDATTRVLALFSFLRLTLSLHCMLGSLRKMTRTLFVRRYLRNGRSLIRSCHSGRCIRKCCKIRLRPACVMCTCFITPNRCQRWMSTLPCVAICRNATTRRATGRYCLLCARALLGRFEPALFIFIQRCPFLSALDSMRKRSRDSQEKGSCASIFWHDDHRVVHEEEHLYIQWSLDSTLHCPERKSR